MLHQRRNWAITPIEDLAKAAEYLSEYQYGLTAAFRTPAGTVWANDSITEDSLQEYAVLRPDGHGRYRQVETITVSWCTAAKLTDYLHRADRGDWDDGETITWIDAHRLSVVTCT